MTRVRKESAIRFGLQRAAQISSISQDPPMFSITKPDFVSEFFQKKFSLKNKTILIDSIHTLPTTKAQMSIDVYFSGDMKGQLKLVGTPCLQETTQRLFFPDLVYQLKFSNGLYTIIAKLYRKKIAKELTTALDIQLDPLLFDLKKEIKNALQEQIARVRKLQKESSAGIKLLQPSSRACIEAASELYCGIVDEVEKIDYEIFKTRAKTSNWRRLKVALPAYLRAIKSR